MPTATPRFYPVLRWTAVFAGFAAFTISFTFWLLSRHYVSDASLWAWSTVVGSLDGEQGGFNRFVLLYPQVQYYLLTMLTLLPGLKSPLIPYLISALTGAALLTHLSWRLMRSAAPRWVAVAVIVLTLTNPAFLWAASNGTGEMMGMALYYLLALSIIALRYSHSMHAHLVLALTLLLFFITDARSIYLALALLPLLPLVIQRHMLKLGAAAPLFVLYMPLIFMIGTWLMLNWVYTRDALYFLQDPGSPFLGARLSDLHLPWRAGFGRAFWVPMLVAAGLLVLCYPIFLLAAVSAVRRSRMFTAVVVLAVTPVLATGLATAAEFTQSPADILVFVLGGVLALLTAGLMSRERVILPLVLLLIGNFGCASLFAKYPATGMQAWTDALAGRLSEPPMAGDLALGLWARNIDYLMLDENSGYAVVAARGHAERMVFTFSNVFKIGVNRSRPGADYVAVPDPRSARGGKDQINRQFPYIYSDGFPGYVLAYDHRGWRVYAREELWPPSPGRTHAAPSASAGGIKSVSMTPAVAPSAPANMEIQRRGTRRASASAGDRSSFSMTPAEAPSASAVDL